MDTFVTTGDIDYDDYDTSALSSAINKSKALLHNVTSTSPNATNLTSMLSKKFSSQVSSNEIKLFYNFV